MLTDNVLFDLTFVSSFVCPHFEGSSEDEC